MSLPSREHPPKDPFENRLQEAFRLLAGLGAPISALARSLLLVAAVVGCASPQPPLEVVPEVDLDRYLGRWYEIASFPQRFQRGCVASTATYSRRDEGRVSVVNECRDESLDGELRRAEAVAWVSDPEESSAKLKVRFFWPFSGDYWIIDLDPEYRYAAVGHPSRNYLWILARTPTLNPTLYRAIAARLEAKGYDLSRLRRTPQPSAP